jgi:glycosyltransferase involved in cell wall biosynthesis
MRILIISQYFWPEEFRINDLALGLQARGHQVTVLTGIPNYPKGEFYPGYGYFRRTREEHDGIAIVRAPLIPRGNGGALRLALNYFSFAVSASFRALFTLPGKFDVIFVFEPSPITVGFPAVFFGRLRYIPVVLWVQDLWPESLSATGAVSSPRLLWGAEQMVRFIYRGCDKVLVQSRAFSASVERLGVAARDILYFPNTAEELYRPVEVASDAPECEVLPDGFNVVFAGNIGAAQDFPTILDAAERLKDRPDIHWVIVGDGRLRNWVESEIRRRGLQKTVLLLGQRPMKEMPLFFALADALLVTLRRDPIFALTIPSKIQSYLACGRPIIAGLDGEGGRIVEEAGAGLACPAGDPVALADAVARLSAMSPDNRMQMGRRGLDYFERHFQRELLLDRLEGWLRELAGRSGGRSPREPGDQRV